MRFDLSTVQLNLAPYVPLTIAEGAGTCFRVVRGRVWLTEEEHLDDIFLSAGMSYRLRSAGRIVVTPERVGEEPEIGASIAIEAPVSVRSPGALQARFRPFWTRCGKLIERVLHPSTGGASLPTLGVKILS